RHALERTVLDGPGADALPRPEDGVREDAPRRDVARRVVHDQRERDSREERIAGGEAGRARREDGDRGDRDGDDERRMPRRGEARGGDVDAVADVAERGDRTPDRAGDLARPGGPGVE